MKNYFPIHDLVISLACEYKNFVLQSHRLDMYSRQDMFEILGIYAALERAGQYRNPIMQTVDIMSRRQEGKWCYEQAIKYMENLLPMQCFEIASPEDVPQDNVTYFVYAQCKESFLLPDNGKSYLVYHKGDARECEAIVRESPEVMHGWREYTLHLAYTAHSLLPLTLPELKAYTRPKFR